MRYASASKTPPQWFQLFQIISILQKDWDKSTFVKKVQTTMNANVKNSIFLPLASMCVKNSSRLFNIWEAGMKKVRDDFVNLRDVFDLINNYIGDTKVSIFGIVSPLIELIK